MHQQNLKYNAIYNQQVVQYRRFVCFLVHKTQGYRAFSLKGTIKRHSPIDHAPTVMHLRVGGYCVERKSESDSGK